MHIPDCISIDHAQMREDNQVVFEVGSSMGIEADNSVANSVTNKRAT